MRKVKLSPMAILMTLTALAAATLLPAQDQKTPPPSAPKSEAAAPVAPEKMVNAVFQIKYANVTQLANVLQAFRRILGGTVLENPELRVIAVSGPKELVSACEEAIKKLDVPSPPSRNVDLTFYLLTASRQPSGAQGEVPPELDKVCEQLKSIAGFKSFKLLDTMIIRAQEGRKARQEGLLPPHGAGGSETPYELGFDSAQITAGEKDTRIHLNKLSLGVRMETVKTTEKGSTSSSASEGGIETDIEFGEGQKAVVGVTGTGGSEALVLVVNGTVLN